MIQEDSIRDPTSAGPQGGASGKQVSAPENWREALQSLLSARIGIIQMEVGPVIQAAIIKVALIGASAFALLITWLLIVTGCVGLITTYASWPWWAAAFVIAACHLILAIALLLVVAKSKSSEHFPITRQEFKKDCEWLNHLKQKPTSRS